MKRLTALMLVLIITAAMTIPVSACWEGAEHWRSCWDAVCERWMSYMDGVLIRATPQISEARYYHGGISRLQICWDGVGCAERYEVKITKGDGTVVCYPVEGTILFLRDVECLKTYDEQIRTWVAATVRVRAIGGKWSEAVKIGCDAIH